MPECPGDELCAIEMGVSVLRTSEREHRMIFRLQTSISTAIVEPLMPNNSIEFDVTFGSRAGPDDPIQEIFVLETLDNFIPPLLANIRSDSRPEGTESFTIRILPTYAYVPGRREFLTCNEDYDVSATSYFCEHTVTIIDDDGMLYYKTVWL